MSEQHVLGSRALRNKPVIVSFIMRELSQDFIALLRCLGADYRRAAHRRVH